MCPKLLRSHPARVALCALTAGGGLPALAQSVQINEFMASNVSIAPDNVDFEDYSDWIELRNTTSAPINLNGYFLTDDPGLPRRWPLPPDATIPANGFLIVRADGFDAAPGETYQRAFSPWDAFQTQRYHTNFKLSQAGEYVGLSAFSSPPVLINLITTGSSWKYYDQGSSPGAAWASSSFDDSLWPSDLAQLGYGEGDEATTVSYGPDPDNKFRTTYFRKEFTVANPSALVNMRGRILVDDGAVIYLNGAEIDRIRIPDGPVTFSTFAANSPEAGFESFAIDVTGLVAGTNVLAVEVHQASDNSSDVSFDLEVTAYQSSETPVLVDSVTFGPQVPDVSYGRNPADGGNWHYFGEPTPGAANTTIPTQTRTPSGSVQVSVPAGFYAAAQSVSLSTGSGNATIRYTLDGSIPTSSSPAFGTPIPVSASTVIRARTFETGHIPGPLATHTYFINEPSSVLPIIAYTVDPDLFFDPSIGIYDNVHKGREAPNTLEFYEPGRTLGFKVNSGTKIGGENIWRFAQKPLNIAMRGKYGNDLISYKIFPDEPIGTFDAVKFRNGGDNWNDAMLRDAMAPSLLQGGMTNDVASYRPSILYLNTNYWGIHNIREKFDDEYFFTRHRVSPGSYDLVAKERTINGTELVADKGDLLSYLDFENFISTNDMAVDANYDAAVAQMELDNFMDYCAVVDFVYESSWHHNQAFWRPRQDGSKWRWIVNDIDRGFNSANVTFSLIDDLISRHPVFDSLRANPRFLNRFAQRYAAHMSSTFHPDRIANLIDTLAAEVDPEIQRHIDRWLADGGIQSLADRQAEIDEIKQFAVDRTANVFSDMAKHLGFPNDTATLTVNVSPANAGRILINGVPMLPSYSTSAQLYRDISFELTAEALPGYTFSGWSTGENSPVIDRTLTADIALTANFLPSGETLIASAVAADTTLTTAGSPYTTTGDILVEPGVTLTIEPGVTIRMPEGASIYVQGALDVQGSAAAPVVIEPRPGAGAWGAIGITNATGTTNLSHLKLVGATLAANDPINLKAAVSALNSTLVMEFCEITAPFPIFTRGGSTTLRSSHIHPTFTSDGINIKGGAGLVEDCVFLGNEAPDTDAIDFDDVVGGMILDNRIYAFRGPNSDGIDLGEGCVNLLVAGNKIYNCSDKGVSVGQGSTTTLERNLIVDCTLGVAVKDTGSSATIDQCTFAENGVAVTAFEKNLLAGGGNITVSNCIFALSKDAHVTSDVHSSVTVAWSLSDSLPLAGSNNFVADPLFTNPILYDFSLLPGSPAFDAGDPAHPLDSDGSRADVGAYYIFSPNDYPFQVPNTVVINEVLAHSAGASPDWIELYNSSTNPVDLGGWFLSDSGSDLQKYRIADGTVIPAGGYLVFTEDQHFGTTSTDPGRLTPFALSRNGETVHLFLPSDGLLLAYHEKESFGPSAADVSKGRYFKSSTNTFNFVALETQTPGAPNAQPVVGPIVISEIMYHPVTGDAEFVELLNIDDTAVTLFDAGKNEPWRITQGFTFDFPTLSPVTMQPGERLLLVQDMNVFLATYAVPPGTQIFQWTSGALSNGGEKIELSYPGDLDSLNQRQFIRLDRVAYQDVAPWPTEPDLGLHSLTRIDDTGYGNDPANWVAALPTPGQSAFELWAATQGLVPGNNGWNDDPDGDLLDNLYEFAIGSNPLSHTSYSHPSPVLAGSDLLIRYRVASGRPELGFRIERSPDLSPGSWIEVPATFVPDGPANLWVETSYPLEGPRMFFRLAISP